ncbi:multidrug effflux MFS transporter [Corynebacterium sp. A21]|uniref:multidrug effflux MFS transporter n=1 Tax=Corynebacterium sp. A21 TaxID=3457318 RepID=UPI003FD1C1AA
MATNNPHHEGRGKPRQELSSGLLFGLALLSAAAPLSTDMYLPALPNIVDELDTTHAMVQLTLSGFMFGMAIGQLIIGPISDATGRKKLLVGGAVVALVASAIAAMAPSIEILILCRLLQGLGSGACTVLARAVVPDLAVGKKAAKAFALLMTIQGIAPVVAPVLGGVLLEPIGWRGIFWVLAAINVAQLLVAVLVVRESLPAADRTDLSLGGVFANYLYVLRNPVYLGYLISFSFGFATLFSYISSSPFLVQEQMNLSVTAFTVVFAVNALGMMIANMINSKLIDRFDTHAILRTAQLLLVFFAVAFLIATQFTLSPWVLFPLLFFAVSMLALIMGNSTALGTGVVRERAGSGAAVMGFLQFGLAALVSPLMGLGSNPALTMATGMVVCALVSFAGQLFAGRQQGRKSA